MASLILPILNIKTLELEPWRYMLPVIREGLFRLVDAVLKAAADVMKSRVWPLAWLVTKHSSALSTHIYDVFVVVL